MTVGYDLVVLGDANPDVIMRGAPDALAFGQVEQEVAGARLTLGGSGALVAHGAARLGLRTGFVGLVGADRAGDFVLGMLSDGGVDISGVTRAPDVDTAMTVIFVRPDGDRAMLTFPGALSTFGLEHIDTGILEHARHVHAASMFLQPRLMAVLASVLDDARRAGAVTSVDTNDDPSGRWTLDREVLLPVVDYLLPNEREAVTLAFGPSTGDDARAAARSLASFGPRVVVKCGAAGAFAVDVDQSVQRAELEEPALELVDAVGAGDTFDAGFIAGLAEGLDLWGALRLAVAAGAWSIRGVGGAEGQPDRVEATRLAEQVRLAED